MRKRLYNAGVALESDSLERLVPDELIVEESTGGETLRLHVERYEFAAREACKGRVLDMACGAGYGTRILADAPGVTSVVGVDISEEAVRYATRRYAGPETRFISSDAMQFSDPEPFDTIVSLETIEHLDGDPQDFVQHLRTLLHRDGVLIASAPTTPSVDVNPNHSHDFTPHSFRKLFQDCGFREIECFRQVQAVSVAAVLRKNEKRMSGVRKNLVAYYATHPAALARRIAVTLRHGFNNHYSTIVWALVDE